MRLVKGQQNDQVALLQQRLGLKPEGYFDNKTQLAVKAWQKANGLVESGDVDDQTWSAMFPPSTTEPTQVKVEPQVQSTHTVKPQDEPKPVIEDGPKQNQAVTPEVNRILSGSSNKNPNSTTSHRR